MKTQDPTRTYAYHFTKLGDNQNRTLSFNQDTQEFSSNFNKISFRYFAQCQQNQKRLTSPQTNITKIVTQHEKTNQPVKKYTFSGLAKQQKQFRKSEDIQHVRSAAITPKYPLNVNKALRNNEIKGCLVENGEQSVFQKHPKQEIKKDIAKENDYCNLKSEKIKLETEILEVKAQNQLLRVRFEEIKKERLQHQDQVRRLNLLIKQAQQDMKELKYSFLILKNEKQVIQASYREAKSILQSKDLLKQKYQIKSKTIDYHLLALDAQLKGVKREEIQLKTSQIQQRYKEILELFNLELNFDTCHQKLVKKIKKLNSMTEQNASLKIVNSEIEKQTGKLLHHLKKNEAELAKICNLNGFLNLELIKATILIENCNEEINILNLKQVQRKLMAKYILSD